MDPIYINFIKKVALIWAGCFVLFLFVHMLVLSPQKKSKKQIENQLAEKKRMYESVLKAAQEETKIQLNEQIERLQDSLRDFVTDFEDSANLTFDISRIANEKKIASFSIETKDKMSRGGSAIPDDYDYMFENHIDVRFTGGFNQFAGLLNALERHRPVVFVDSFVIARSKKSNLDHEVRMDLSVFVRKRQDG